MFRINNFKNGLLTSLLGIVCWVSAIFSVFLQENITWTDALIPFILGIALILMPDKVSGIMRKIIGKYSAIIGLLLVWSCKTSKSIPNQPPASISTKISVTATVPKDSLTATIPVERLKVDTATYFYSASTKRVTASIKLKADKSLEVKCKCDSAKATNEVVYTPIIPKPITQPCTRKHADEQNWLERTIVPAFKQTFLILLATLLFLSGYKFWLSWYTNQDNDKLSF